MANVTTIYACTEDGLAIFNKPGTLNEWLPPRHVLGGMPVSSVWAEAGPPVRMVAVQDGNLLVSANGGRSWDIVETERNVVSLFDGVTEHTLYASLVGGGLLRSNDAGATWNRLSPMPSETRAAITAGDTLYVVADGSLLSGKPEEGKWRALCEGVRAVGYDEAKGKLYAATDEGIAESEDEGANWVVLTGSPKDATALLVVPGPAGRAPALVVGNQDGLSVSPNAGESWEQKDVGGRVIALSRDPERRDRLYAGTREGYIFESGNRGQVWAPVNSAPMPSVISLFLVRI